MSKHKLALLSLLLLLALLLPLLLLGKPQEEGDKTFPPYYEVESDDENIKGAGPETTDHAYYYNMTIWHGNEERFADAYVDVPMWIKEGGAQGQTEHSHLNDAYRKAADVRLNFDFPFYGHPLRKVTIATGGFLYVGDRKHSWLAASQYIAPLMANFDTLEMQSSILYGDDGKRMIVEWRDVTLRDNREAGNFTFQVQLWRNGDITFVYKEVPFAIVKISDAQHPCKLGISDAYFYSHKVNDDDRLSQSMPHQQQQQSNRVIHEYQRISIPGEKIASKTVVHLKALPTCLEATSCEECTKKRLKQFKCTWCDPKEKNGKGKETDTTDDKPFCSDQQGLHRRSQEWIEGHCQVQEKNKKCKSDEEHPLLPPNSSSTEANADAKGAKGLWPPSSSARRVTSVRYDHILEVGRKTMD